MTCTFSSPRSPSRPRAAAVPAPPLPGSENERYTRRFAANSGSIATSSSPPCPSARTFGTPASGSDSFPLGSTIRSRPGRSVTRMRPSGRNASAHGCSSPRATVSTRNAPSIEDGVGERGAPPSCPLAGGAVQAESAMRTASVPLLRSLDMVTSSEY